MKTVQEAIPVCAGESLGREVVLLFQRGTRRPFIVSESTPGKEKQCSCYSDLGQAMKKLMSYEGLYMTNAL